MKALDLILLIQKTCKTDDEIFITDVNRGLKYNPDIALLPIYGEENLKSLDDEKVDPKKAFHIW